MPRLVLLERDGVINEDRPDVVRNPDQLVLLPGAAAAIARLNAAGIKVAVTTHQPAVGRGLLSLPMLDRIHAELRSRLAREGAHLDALHVCIDPPARDARCPARRFCWRRCAASVRPPPTRR